MRRGVGSAWLAALTCLLSTVSWATPQQADSVIRITCREKGRMLVPVAINRKKESSFLFDTGATTTVLSERLAAQAGVTGKILKPVVTFAGPVSLPVGRVDSLRIGCRSVPGLEVVIADLGRLFNLDADIGGILGEDVLSGFNFLLDRRHGTLQIDETGALPPHLSGTRIACEKRAGKIFVPAAGGNIRLILDSGNPYLVIYQDAASAVQPGVHAKETRLVQSAIGTRRIGSFRIDSLEIGQTSLHNLDAYLATRTAGRTEDGFLPVEVFDSIYVNNLESSVIINPKARPTAKGNGND